VYQPFDLAGRGVMVTGGNGGIGYGMARALLAAGAEVANDRRFRRDRGVSRERCFLFRPASSS
jgi:NAD(P)-dependent dehydrogenase (short-subunit alcohol dehydrogenase family)